MKKFIIGGSYVTGPMVVWGKLPNGYTVEGTIVGYRDGKFGRLADVKTTAGEVVTLTMPAALARALARVPVGVAVEVVYRGRETGKDGKSYHAFQVSVDDEAALLPEGVVAEISHLRVEAPTVAAAKKPAW